MKTNNKKRLVLIIVGAAVLVIAVTAAILWGMHSRRQEEIARQLREQDEIHSMAHFLERQKEMEILLNVTRIYDGVTCMGVDLSGMTQAEAQEAIEKEIDETVLQNQVSFEYGDKKWSYTFEELGASADAAALAEKAFAIGRRGDLQQRFETVLSLKTEPEEILVDVALDSAKTDEVVAKMAEEIEQKPVDAVVVATGSGFSVTPEKKGLSLDQEKTKAAIRKTITEKQEDAKVALTVKEVIPEKTAEKLSTIKDKIGSYSTYYGGNYGREQNLITGASKINGVVLMPDEVLSFNDTVAPITAENGYHEANVIVGDEYVPGLGGGLCQVSTTLYNAVIRAELEVVERDCHSFPSDYVPLGLDSTVAQGYIDFKFKNTSGHPVYISMWCGGGEIGAAIYGTEIHDPSRTLSFDYVVTEVIPKPAEEVKEDPTMEAGKRVVTTEGHTGYQVDVYKTVSENGSSYTEWFSSSSYMATPDKVKVGTAKPASKPVDPTPKPDPKPEPEPTPQPEPEPTPEPPAEEESSGASGAEG